MLGAPEQLTGLALIAVCPIEQLAGPAAGDIFYFDANTAKIVLLTASQTGGDHLAASSYQGAATAGIACIGCRGFPIGIVNRLVFEADDVFV